MAILSFYACVNLHRLAIEKVFRAPMSFFDTTVGNPLLRLYAPLTSIAAPRPRVGCIWQGHRQ